MSGNAPFDTPVTYLDEAKREMFRLHVDEDGLLRNAAGRLFDTSDAGAVQNPGSGRAIFVMDRHGRIYAAKEHSAGQFHHSSFLSGQPVAAAGELGVKDGKVHLISNQSGHYKPGEKAIEQFMRHLFKREGAQLDESNLDVHRRRATTKTRSRIDVFSDGFWRPVVNALLYTVQFREDLDEDYATHIARHLIDRPLVDRTAEQQYAALAEAAETGTDLTQLEPEAHSEADFRAFMSMVVAQMDALRPWPEQPFERIPLERWDQFPNPVVIGRLTLMAPEVQDALRMFFRTLQDTDQLCLALRLESGALVALVAQWWPGSFDTAVITQDGQRDPDEILQALLEATRCSEDVLLREAS